MSIYWERDQHMGSSMQELGICAKCAREVSLLGTGPIIK